MRRTKRSEFVACKDTWFRPVQFANCRTVAFTLSICTGRRSSIRGRLPELKKHLDLDSGSDRGRFGGWCRKSLSGRGG